MILTNAQLTTLATDITGRSGAMGGGLGQWAAAKTNHDAPAVAAFYNFTANPAVSVWITNLSLRALTAAVNWKDYQALNQNLRDTYMAISQICIAGGSIDMSDQGTARGLVGMSGQTDGVFVDGSTSAANIRAASVRNATYFEALFSSVGGGTLSTANVCAKDKGGNSIFGQALDAATVALAMGW